MKRKAFITGMTTLTTITLFSNKSKASGGNDDDDNDDDNDDDDEKKVCGKPKELKAKEWKSDEITFEKIKTEFAQKFPLKMVVMNQKGGETEECIVFTIGERRIPGCSINTFLKIIRWPLYLRYIIWSVMEL